MHLPLLKALVAVVSATVLAIGVALAPAAGAHRPRSPRPADQTTSLEADGLRFLGQLATANVKPDPALEDSWTGDVTAVLVHHVRDDLDRAERDQAVSPAAATVLLDALSTALGKS